MHIIILHYSVLIKFVPTTTTETHRLPIERDAIAVSNSTHIYNDAVLCFYSKIFQCNIVAIITMLLLQ